MQISREYRLFSIRDSFLAQHVVEPTRGENVLDIVLSPQNELVDYVKYINHWERVIIMKYILTSMSSEKATIKRIIGETSTKVNIKIIENALQS